MTDPDFESLIASVESITPMVDVLLGIKAKFVDAGFRPDLAEECAVAVFKKTLEVS